MNPLIFNKDLNQIEDLINSHLNIKQNKKVESGEVFTPFYLIIEMLEKLPNKIWQDPKLKWLDPGSGIGNFSMLVFYYLDNGLKKWEKNVNKRRKHIIENMIYMIELSEDNVKISRNIFGNNANICNCDYLLEKEKWNKKFNIDKFDIILGNPPYNKNGMRGKGRSNPGLTVIWNKFVENSLDYINPKGYCLFFTPNSWMELKSDLSDKILKNQIVLIKNFDVVNAYKLFDKKAGSLPLCYYLIQNKEPTENTLIHDSLTDEFVEFNINKFLFIPNKNIYLMTKILNKSNDTLEDYYHFTPPKVKKDKNTFFDSYSKTHPYPLINYVHKKIYITYSKNYSRLQNGRPKLIFPNYSMGYPILDTDGILDVGGRSSYAILLEDNDINKLKKIQEFFMTNLAFTLINSLKTAQKFLSTRTFSIFPDVTKLNISINDTSLEKYFNLTSKEKKSIEYQIKHGEGNVTSERRKEIFNFSLDKYLSSDEIGNIKTKLKIAQQKDKKTFKTLKKRKRTKRKKNTRSRKNN